MLRQREDDDARAEDGAGAGQQRERRAPAAQRRHADRAGDGAGTQRRHQQPESLGALVQHVASDERNDDVEVEREQAHDDEQPERERHRRRAGRVADRADETLPDTEPAGRIGSPLGPDREERRQDGDEARAVEEERDGHVEARDEQAGEAGADDAGAVEDHRVERDGVGKVGPADQIGEEGLAGRDVDRATDPVDHGEHRDVPVADVAAAHEQREHESLHHHRGLGDEQDAALAPAVAQRAAHGREQENRRELQRVHEPELERRARQLQHEPRLSDALHPRADERDELAAPEQPEVAMPEGAERH